MKTVNYWYIWDAFSELEHTEARHGRPLNIDANDEMSMRNAFDLYVRPWVSRLKPESISLLRLSLAYFLKKPDFTGGEVLAHVPDLTLNRPENERIIFEWMWRSLFPDVDYRTIDTSECIEDNDMMKVNEFSE
jgi:hypothetical protein